MNINVNICDINETANFLFTVCVLV